MPSLTLRRASSWRQPNYQGASKHVESFVSFVCNPRCSALRRRHTFCNFRQSAWLTSSIVRKVRPHALTPQRLHMARGVGLGSARTSTQLSVFLAHKLRKLVRLQPC